MFFLKLKTKMLGKHTHVDIWMGKDTETYGKCGNLVFRNKEWDALANAIMDCSWPKCSDSNSNKNGVISHSYLKDLTITLDEAYDDTATK